MAQPESGITVIRTADGSYYVLRPEILNACRVTEPEYIQRLEQMMGDQDVAGFSMATSSTQITRTLVASPTLSPTKPNIGSYSTVMCPDW